MSPQAARRPAATSPAAPSPAAPPIADQSAPAPEVICRASPSLALLKYWGKRAAPGSPTAPGERGGRTDPGSPGGRLSLPATPSLAVTLGGLSTETRVRAAEADRVILDGRVQPMDRFGPFFDHLRRRLGTALRFQVQSASDFPSSAGLASSSSGFAALAAACARLAGASLSGEELSALARAGSVSAARAVFGGFVLLPAGARSARPLYGPEHWPDLRILAVIVSREAKPLSSRDAMERTRLSSPYYRAWLRDSAALLPQALEALARRDLERLGEAAVLSYTRMHATMMAARPPLLYWRAETVEVIQECARMRREGIGAWETIDAGPQVKILCLQGDAEAIRRRVLQRVPQAQILAAYPGPAPQCEVRGETEAGFPPAPPRPPRPQRPPS